MRREIHIAVVDDELEIREPIAEFLRLKGYRVSCAADAAEMRRLIEKTTVDLAVLDISMPGEDGLSLARYLSATTTMSIVMLTALGETVDRIVGLEVGADDYLAKPVDLRELEARLGAILRRRADLSASRTERGGADQSEHLVQLGRFTLNLESHALTGPDAESVHIAPMEFRILKALVDSPGRVLSRDHIFGLMHDHATGRPSGDRSVDLQVSRLRQKIEDDPRKPRIIKTVHGQGYVFKPDC